MKTKLSLLMTSFLFAIISASFAQGQETKNPAIVVHLLDYLAKDYGGAVKDGKVVSASEYQEQVEFAAIVSKASKTYEEFKGDLDFSNGVQSLVSQIDSKADATEVAKAARVLQSKALSLAKIQVSPQEYPMMSEGRTVFAQNCAACHGDAGKGDGPAGKGLDPAPANFHDPDGQLASSPYQYFNTIRLGVPGTGMPSFPSLSDKEIWALAFYVKSLSRPVVGGAKEPSLALGEVSKLKDEEILQELSGDSEQKLAQLNAIRTFEPSVKPESQYLAVAKVHLQKSMDHFKSGDYELAVSESVKSYLQGIEPLEPKIKANKSGLVEKVESQMSSYRSSLTATSSLVDTTKRHDAVLATFAEIQEVTEAKMMSPQLAFTAAFAIFMREGFEAVLIIITLLGVIKAFGAKKAARWVHFGWMSALAVGILVWFASGLLIGMSGASREIMEGAISLFAVVVLLYVGFWLHRQTEVGRWTKFVKETLKDALENKSLFVLTSISFMAVFREAFEVVLFLRAIWNDVDADGKLSVGFAVGLSFMLILAFSFYAVRYTQKIPLKRLFNISALVMGVLAVILVGKGIHSLQEAGLVGVNSLGLDLRIDLFGLYPSWQTVLAQIVVLGVLGLIWNFGTKPAAVQLKNVG